METLYDLNVVQPVGLIFSEKIYGENRKSKTKTVLFSGLACREKYRLWLMRR